MRRKKDFIVGVLAVHIGIYLQLLHQRIKLSAQCSEAYAVIKVAMLCYVLFFKDLTCLLKAAKYINAPEARLKEHSVQNIHKGC